MTPINIDRINGLLEGAPVTERRLSDLRGIFADGAAYERALEQGDPIIYTVSSIEAGNGEGDLHYGVGRLMPGRVGDEFHMTKGHLHSWRPAAEVYIGLAGKGMMLLEDEATGESRLIPLEPDGIVYVPGHTAHRTINIGEEPLVYIGIFPARAGHDYAAIAESNFRKIVVDDGGRWKMVDRG
jgi:glucose-6-phosphate isomerase